MPPVFVPWLMRTAEEEPAIALIEEPEQILIKDEQAVINDLSIPVKKVSRQKQIKAATKIQAIVRGWLTRLRFILGPRKAYLEAVTRIESHLVNESDSELCPSVVMWPTSRSHWRVTSLPEHLPLTTAQLDNEVDSESEMDVNTLIESENLIYSVDKQTQTEICTCDAYVEVSYSLTDVSSQTEGVINAIDNSSQSCQTEPNDVASTFVQTILHPIFVTDASTITSNANSAHSESQTFTESINQACQVEKPLCVSVFTETHVLDSPPSVPQSVADRRKWLEQRISLVRADIEWLEQALHHRSKVTQEMPYLLKRSSNLQQWALLV